MKLLITLSTVIGLVTIANCANAQESPKVEDKKVDNNEKIFEGKEEEQVMGQVNLEKRNYTIFFNEDVIMEKHYNPLVDYLSKQNITILDQDYKDELKFIDVSLDQSQRQILSNLKEDYKIDAIESDQDDPSEEPSGGILRDYDMPSDGDSDSHGKFGKVPSFEEKDEF